MPRRQIGALVGAVGIVAILIAVLANPLGIGNAEDTFGWKQVVLLGIGIALVIAGAVTALRSPPDGGNRTTAAE
jgi:sugar phosphate permease